MSAPSAEFLKEAIFLVDSSSYVFRAYYAIQRPLHAPDGTPTHATFGFLQMVQALLDMHGLAHCVLVWDRSGKGFRHEIYPKYKANRSVPPEDLGIQIQNAREAATYLGLPQIDSPGFEADDIFATLIGRHPDERFVIVTADKDLLQLVGPNVWCLDTMKRQWSNVDEAREKFGVEPSRIREVQALCGDSVDNVPGVPGVGPKSAIELIQHFGDLETVLRTAEARAREGGAYKDPLKGKRLENVAAHAQDARVSLELVSLRADAPISEDFVFRGRHDVRAAEFLKWAEKLGFSKTAAKLIAQKKTEAPAALSASSPASDSEDGSEPREELSAAPSPPADFKTRCVTNLEELDLLLASQGDARLVALDTETHSLEHLRPHNLVGLSLSFASDLGYYVPLRHRAPATNLEAAPVLTRLMAYFERQSRHADFTLVFQNAKFDLHALANDGFRIPPQVRIDDTMVAHFVLDPSASHGLDALSVKWLQGYRPLPFAELVGKGEDFSMVELEKATFYAAEDAVVCRRLWQRLEPALREASLWEVYDRIDRPLIPILLEMERHGIPLDVAALKESSHHMHLELLGLQEKAIATLKKSGLEVPAGVNLNSTKQVAQILYEKLGLPVIKKGKTGPSTDVSVLQELALQHAFPRILLEIREITKLLTTYLDALPGLTVPETGRVHTDFSQTVAATGRLSSSNPNLQNIPIKSERGRRIRQAFKAPPGSVLVGVDYSQIELRLLAFVSRDPQLLQAFQDNADIHRRTAALVLGKTEDQVDDDDRRIAKTINYGIVYGQTAFGLSKSLGIPRAVAQKFIDGYFATYAGIREYMDRAVLEARDTGAVRTLSGRRRLMPEIHSKNSPVRQFAERTAINSPIQGLAADLMKVAMIAVAQRVRREWPQAKLLLQVHDELVFEVPAAQAEALKSGVVEAMQDRHLLNPFGVPDFDVLMKAEAGVGANWGQL